MTRASQIALAVLLLAAAPDPRSRYPFFTARDLAFLNHAPDSLYLQEAKLYTIPCKSEVIDSSQSCPYLRQEFLHSYVDAFGGHYTAQQNIAYDFNPEILITPESGVRSNPIQSCAWRLVILRSGSPHITPGDAARAGYACDSLTTLEREAATARATTIRDAIRRHPAQPLPDSDDDGP